MKPLRLSLNDIKNAYNGVKAQAIEAYKKGDYELCMQYVRHCATIAQQFNWIYADEELEDLLNSLSFKIIPYSTVEYSPIDNRVVFYDDYSMSFILALQYIEALVAAQMHIMYVTVENQNGKYSTIVPIIKSKYPEIEICIVPNKSLVQIAQDVYQTVISFRPQKILLHLFGHSAIIPFIYAINSKVETYLINVIDQMFWLGANAVDYVLEFRQFGVSVSQQRRGLKSYKQLLVPFYPIVDNNPFQGLPKECTEDKKVVIFSGGDIYKVLDEKRMYWHLVKRVMDTYPEVVFLFATKGDNLGMEFLQSFIHSNHYEGRFIYTKFRSDINEVMAHVDIFMGTCPVCGSLMSQLAARNATPILQYYYPGTPDDETEQAICINEQFKISFDDEELFMQEAERLIKDVGYRKQQGKRLQKAMISKEQFNELVFKSITTNKTQFALCPYQINYKILDDRWFDLEKAGYMNSMSYLYGLLKGIFAVGYAPLLCLKKHINTLINHINKFTKYN